jgi:hypothetical protein
MQLLDIDDDSLLNVTPLSTDRHLALQQRQRTTEILIQKIQVKYLIDFYLNNQKLILDVKRTFNTKRRIITRL